MNIKINELGIRNFREDDRAAIAELANNEKVAANLLDMFPHPYTQRDAAMWVDMVNRQDPVTDFAVTLDDRFIGVIGAKLKEDVYRVSAEIGYWLGEPYWGRGYMTRVVSAFSAESFDRYTVQRLYAGMFSTNPASGRVLEKAGYRKEAVLKNAIVKNGVIQDLIIYSLLKEEMPAL